MALTKKFEAKQPESGREYLCHATFFPVRRWRDIIPFLRMSSRVQAQLRPCPGLIRYALRAELLRKRFWTFSVWEDEESVQAFLHAEPHAEAMRRMKEWVAPDGAVFTGWTSRGGAIDWTAIRDRVWSAPPHTKPAGGEQSRK